MDHQTVRIESIAGAEYIVSENVVIFKAADDDSPSLELPLHLLPRLIGLSLNLAGKISQVDGESSTPLYLDKWRVTTSDDNLVLMEVELPGGAPLTFAMRVESANMLGLMLIQRNNNDT